jgi:multidrug efflux pump subunit AcrB
MAGVTKALFVPLSLAVGFAMLASYFLSNTLVPILSVWLLGKKLVVPPSGGEEGVINAFDKAR